MKMKYFLTVVVVTLSVGCAQTKWVNYRDGSASYSQDKAVCENEAIRVVPSAPPKVVDSQASPATSYVTNCQRDGYNTNCRTTPVAQRKNKTNDFLDGLNRGLESSGGSSEIDRYAKNCLTQKGWNRETVSR
jgi:hypothetical protein